jgi:hypothetical protein
MKWIAMRWIAAACFAICVPGMGQNQSPTHANWKVPDEATAVKIAEAKLVSVYGKKQIESERPLHAELNGDVWTVWGTLNCPDGKGGMTTICVGGVAQIKIFAADARILSVRHGQ